MVGAKGCQITSVVSLPRKIKCDRFAEVTYLTPSYYAVRVCGMCAHLYGARLGKRFDPATIGVGEVVRHLTPRGSAQINHGTGVVEDVDPLTVRFAGGTFCMNSNQLVPYRYETLP